MVAHFPIGYVVYAKVFLSAQGEPACDLRCFMPECSSGIEPHKVIAEPDILLVCMAEVAFGEADVMNSIQDIGLAHTIIAYEAIYFFRKSKVLLFVVFEISKMDSTEKQSK